MEMMKMINSKACTEVYYIINEMSDELRTKIPQNIIKNIKENMDNNYQFDVENKDIETINLLEDTEKILSILYTDYIATEYERKVIKAKEKILLNKYKK